MKKNETKKRRRSFLDRPDGRYLRSLTTMAKLVPFIMPTRVELEDFGDAAVSAQLLHLAAIDAARRVHDEVIAIF